MKTRSKLLSLLALTAVLGGCFDSITGSDETPKEDTDDGSGKQEIVAAVTAASPLAG